MSRPFGSKNKSTLLKLNQDAIREHVRNKWMYRAAKAIKNPLNALFLYKVELWNARRDVITFEYHYAENDSKLWSLFSQNWYVESVERVR